MNYYFITKQSLHFYLWFDRIKQFYEKMKQGSQLYEIITVKYSGSWIAHSA